MPELPIECIFGVGKVTAEAMHKKGLFKCKDIQALSQLQLKQIFGNRAQDMYELSRGIDRREVCTHRERKSLTVEETFSRDLQTWEEIEANIPALFEDFERRMERGQHWKNLNGWVVKLKFFDFKATTHEITGKAKPSLNDFVELMKKAYLRQQKPVRLMGLGARLKENSKAEAAEPIDEPVQLSIISA